MVADWLRSLEATLAGGGEEELATALVSLAYAAGGEIELPEAERRGAGRRGLLLLATGGDPARGLDLDGRAVRAVATDLEWPERQAALRAGLDELAAQARSLPHVAELLRALQGDPDTAWRAFAASVLAEELDDSLGDEDEPPQA
jgi:hypothetical protein